MIPKTGNWTNVLLGSGDPTLFNLLGGSFGNAGDVVMLQGGFGARVLRSAKDKILAAARTSSGGGGGGGGGAGCVHIDMWVLTPGGPRKAGDIQVGDTLLLVDGSEGTVTYSQRKLEPCYRIVTAGPVSLVCSASAPIPVRCGGYRTPNALLGQEARPLVDGKYRSWDVFADVQFLGEGEVQHITVEDECFWAGEREGAYLPHHNAKPGAADRV